MEADAGWAEIGLFPDVIFKGDGEGPDDVNLIAVVIIGITTGDAQNSTVGRRPAVARTIRQLGK